MFASNAWLWWANAIRTNGVVRWPYGAAETAPVDDRDAAAVAARTLFQNGHAGGDSVLGSWPRAVVDVLLDAWGATLGKPAYITSTVADIFGSPARTFRQSVAGDATAFLADRRVRPIDRPCHVIRS